MPLSNTTISTLSAAPYWDDFSESNKFYRVLFKPKFPVQTRELNQIQSIAQNQVSKLGAGIFKEGAAVVGGNATFSNNVIALQLVRSDAVDISNFYDANTGIGAIVRGNTSKASGRVVQIAAQSSESYAAAIIVPISSDQFLPDESVSFVTANTGSTIATMSVAPSPVQTKNAAIFSVQAGTFFLKGHLVEVSQQTIVLSSNTNLVSKRIGLQIAETIVTSDDDDSLLDPAFGTTNYAAPGANRLKLTGTLVAMALTGSSLIEQNSDENFIEISRVINGSPAATIDRLEPSLIEETLARRTHDESGDYVTSPFRLSAKPHNPPISVPNATGTINGNTTSAVITEAGVSTAFTDELEVGNILVVNGEKREIATVSNNSTLTVNSAFSVEFSNSAFTIISDDKLNLELEAGKAYVRGHEFETKGTTIVEVDRPRTTQPVNNGNVGTGFGPYVYVTRDTTSGGLFDVTTLQQVDLHCVPVSNIANAVASGYNSTKIGTARVRSFVYAVGSGNANTVYKMHIIGTEYQTKTLPLGTGTANSTHLTGIAIDTAAKTLTLTQNTTTTGATIIPSAAAMTYVGSQVTLYRNDGGTHSYYVLNSVGTAVNANLFTQVLTLSSGSFLDTINANANVVISFTEKCIRGLVNGNTKVSGATVDVLSKIGNISTGNTVLFGTSSPGLIFRFPESWIAANTIDDDNFEAIRYFSSITSSGTSGANTLYTITLASTATDNSSFYPVGSSGVAGQFTVANSIGRIVSVADISVAISWPTAVLEIPTSRTNGSAISVYGHVSVTTAVPKTKVLYVGNTNTSSVGVSGSDLLSNTDNNKGHIAINTIYSNSSPSIVSLGVADVRELRAVYAVPDATNTASWVDVTERYALDNGQRSWCYDWASIVLKPGYSHYQSANAALVVIDRFQSTSNGFFTGKSYIGSGLPDEYVDIPEFRDPQTGSIIPLRDCVDFRPIRTANTAAANTAANPYVNAAAVFGTQVIPSPDATFEADYEFYLPRIDKLVLTRSGEFKALYGLPSTKPVPPADAENSMTLYTVVYPAYTANVSSVQITATDHRRYTMRDIGRLEKRIENLEYYVQLSLLEERTLNQSEFDANDNERFKNGILIDSFASYSVANAQDTDFRASIDFTNRELRPSFRSHGFKLGGFNSENSDGVVKVGNGLDDVVMLEYTSNTFISQPLASSAVNINPFSVASWRGNLVLSPATDQWMDTISRGTVVVNLYNENDGWVVGQDYGFGTVWGDWVDNWSGKAYVITDVQTGWSEEHSAEHEGKSEQYITTITTSVNSLTNTQTRTGSETIARASIVSKDLGERVVDSSISPFMRSAEVVLAATGLKPNSNLVFLFDEVDVTNFVDKANEIRLANSAFANLFVVGETVTSNAGAVGTAKIAGIINDTLRVVDATGKFFVTSDNVKITGSISGANVAVSEYVSFSGVFQGATNTSVLLLDTGALATTNAYYNNVIFITSGTGSNQRSRITSYNSSTKAVTIDPPVVTVPDSTSTYSIGVAKADSLTTQVEAGVGFNAANSYSVLPGAFHGLFRLPGTSRSVANGVESIITPPIKFNTGSRVFRISDNASASYATTQTEAAYQASGWTKTVENTVVNTREISFRQGPTQSQTGIPVTTTTTTTASNTVWTGVYVDPIAQTFLVDGTRYGNGVFITSVDLFFAKIDTENIPVTVQIRPTINGYPSADSYLTQTVKYPLTDGINVVPSATTPNPSNTAHYTRFTFPSPVYLLPGQEYAIVILSDSFEYELFVGEIGKQIVGSNRVISEQPYGGSLFKSQNARTWTAEQSQDLMFVLNNAQFGSSGEIALRLDETITSNSVGTDSAGNFDFDLVNIQTGHLEFAPTANATVYNIAFIPVATNTISLTLDSIRTDQDIVLSERMRIQPNNANSVDFRINVGTVDPNVSPVYDLARQSLIAVRNVVDNGQLYTNALTILSGGAGYPVSNSFVIVANDTFGTGAVITAYTNSSGVVNSVAVTVNGSGYIETPTLTWSESSNGSANLVLVYRGETSTNCASIGEQKARYITRRVVLADGFDASDVKVYFTACRPPNTNIDVYCKVLASGDPETFSDKSWQRLVIKSEQSTVFSRNSRDYREFEYRSSANTMSYTDNNVKYDRFHTFAIKLVLRSVSTSTVPVIKNLRAIALDE
jgi:hypothetical protein